MTREGITGLWSGDGPGVAAGDERAETGLRVALDAALGGEDLVARLVVVRRPLDLAEDPDRRLVEVARVGEPGDRERRRGVGGVRVVDEQVGLGRRRSPTSTTFTPPVLASRTRPLAAARRRTGSARRGRAG